MRRRSFLASICGGGVALAIPASGAPVVSQVWVTVTPRHIVTLAARSLGILCPGEVLRECELRGAMEELAFLDGAIHAASPDVPVRLVGRRMGELRYQLARNLAPIYGVR